MSTKTTNLEMTLLAEEDNFDTNVYNENFQKTDDKIGELNSMLGSEELTTTSQTHSGAINELNKNLCIKTADSWIEAYTNAKVKIDVCLECYAINKYLTFTITIPVSSIEVGKTFISGYYFSSTSNGVTEVSIKSDTEITATIHINSTTTTITKTTFLYY